MLFSLETKDVVGPLVSIGAAALSAFLFWKNYTLTRRNSDRAIYIEGQKFLLEICKQLMADPSLWCIYDEWCIYDDEELQKDSSVNEATPLFRAKIRAFAHLQKPPPGGSVAVNFRGELGDQVPPKFPNLENPLAKPGPDLIREPVIQLGAAIELSVTLNAFRRKSKPRPVKER